MGIKLQYKMKNVNQYPSQSGKMIDSFPEPFGNKYQKFQKCALYEQYIKSLSNARTACVPRTMSMARFTTRSRFASFIGVRDEFLAILVSLPVYTTTPKHQAVFFSCVPRNKKLSAPRACWRAPSPAPSCKLPVKVWIDLVGASAWTTPISEDSRSTAWFSSGGPAPASASPALSAHNAVWADGAADLIFKFVSPSRFAVET
mmetsp:Transcript_36699/g.110897  ORF Transcript_36699/g.110897 Transcript_36699/m.110897 type:complete len:202 (+) Transcript_36699:2210-2815(+)